MPELPEVETLRRDLEKIKGLTIQKVKVEWPKMVKPLTVFQFTKKIKGQKIKKINRRSKVLIIEFSSDLFLLVHLKMTGQLIYQPKKGSIVMGGHPQKDGHKDLPNKFTHIIISFTNGSNLYFNDVRKFGWMRLVDKKGLIDLNDSLGVESISSEFTLEKFTEILKRYPNRKIKQLLLDQKLISGLGNIYVDESCYMTRIKPTRIVKSLTKAEIKNLHKNIIKILNFAIEKRGTSFRNYRDLEGKTGNMVKYLKVYGRVGQKCKRCGGIIKKIRLNGRGTQYCDLCQK